MTNNPFTVLEAKLDQLALDVRALKRRTEAPTDRDEIGGIELAQAVTGLAASTIYKKVHRSEIPYSKRGGRLFFSRRKLEEWCLSGSQK
ncbi:MAG: helix-turn-helix domain-containing protein [Planctomycetes bacterium]|nr:helix-turn-helix domain-containing protein [Planctomycetota bacterium]